MVSSAPEAGVSEPGLRVAVTGNMGSGKSSFASFLGARGARVVDADSVARQLLASDPGVRQTLADAFGQDLLTGDGHIRRDLLAERAFADESSRRRLDDLIREPLEKLLFIELAEAAAVSPLVILDAPLLFEWGIESHFDVIIVVASSSDNALAHLLRRGVSREQAVRRRAMQWPQHKQVERAHIVIDNNQDLAHLEQQADTTWIALQSRLAAKGDGGSE